MILKKSLLINNSIKLLIRIFISVLVHSKSYILNISISVYIQHILKFGGITV